MPDRSKELSDATKIVVSVKWLISIVALLVTCAGTFAVNAYQLSEHNKQIAALTAEVANLGKKVTVLETAVDYLGRGK